MERSLFSEVCAQTLVHGMFAIQSWCHGCCFPYQWIAPRMCVRMHAWQPTAFSWLFVVVLCTSPVGDNERPWLRVRLLIGAGVRAATAVRIARLSVKKFYELLTKFIKLFRRLCCSPPHP